MKRSPVQARGLRREITRDRDEMENFSLLHHLASAAEQEEEMGEGEGNVESPRGRRSDFTWSFSFSNTTLKPLLTCNPHK